MSGDDSKNSEISLEGALCLLDRWRHLPAYQLERRADILFALFLPEVLEKHFDIEINPLLIPEFPIKQKGGSSSNKVDYFALQGGESAKRAFLIELKTDMASRREEQDKYLRDALDDGLKEVVMGIIALCRATDHKAKYVHLLRLLSCLNLVEYDDELFPVQRGPFGKALDRIETEAKDRECWPLLEVVYVQPRLPANTIDFAEFADAIAEGRADSIRRVFAGYLRKWACEDAGSPDPKKWSPA